MLSYLASTARFVTVEADEERALAARDLFRDQPNAQVIHGDWHEILTYGPFDLLFIDAGVAKTTPDQPAEDAEVVAGMIMSTLHTGGIAVLDDLYPEEYWPEEWRDQPDPIREFWLNDARVNATEVLTTPRTIAIVATRI
jgi:predicted O-methyltransferase YrrM